MHRAIIFLALVGIAFANVQLTEDEIEALTKHMQEIEHQKFQEAQNFQPQNIIPARKACTRDTECPLSQNCVDVPSALYDVLKTSNSLIAYEFVRFTMGITGGECVENIGEWINTHASQHIPSIEGELEKIGQYANNTMEKKQVSGLNFFSKATKKLSYEPMVNAPVARAGLMSSDPSAAGFGEMLPFLLLTQVGTNGLGDNDMLMYMMMMDGGSGGMLNNPLLLLSLASQDSDSGSTDSMLELILLTSLFDSQNGMGSVMPLFLIMSMGDGGELTDILPLILMTNMFNPSNGQNDPMQQLLPLLLMSNSTGGGDFLQTFLMITLLGSAGGNSGIGLGNDILPLLLLLGGSNDSMSSDFLMNFLLISFFGGSNSGDDILPLLLMLKDEGSTGMDISTLALVLSMSNMGTGGIGSILPLLMLTGSSSSDGGISDLLLISVLGGQGMNGPAGDISNLMLPLLLGGDSIDEKTIVMLLLLSTSMAPAQPVYPQSAVVGLVPPSQPIAYPAVNNQYQYPVQNVPDTPVYAEPQQVVNTNNNQQYQWPVGGQQTYQAPVDAQEPANPAYQNPAGQHPSDDVYKYPVVNRKRRSLFSSGDGGMSQFLMFFIIQSLSGESGENSLMSILLIMMLSQFA